MTTTTKVLIGIGVALLIGIIFYFVIKDYKTVEYPFQKETFEKIMEMLSTKIEVNFSNSLFGEPLNQIDKLSKALKYSGIQTRLPFEFEIR